MGHCGTPDSMENVNKSSLKCEQQKIYNKLDDGDGDIDDNNKGSSNVSVSHTILFTTRQKQFILRDEPCYVLT
jgi:hypothetical protein